MTSLVTVSQALELVPVFDPNEATVDPLEGGLTNCTYRVFQGDVVFVLRLDSSYSNIVQSNRLNELFILGEAAKAGLAPEVIFSNLEFGILVTEYLPGQIWVETDLGDSENIEKLADLLRSVHGLPICGYQHDMAEIAVRYRKPLKRFSDLDTFASKCIDIIRSIRSVNMITCCHCDVVVSNLVEGNRLQLLDWEFAADCDPFFDLASVIGFHKLDNKHTDMLLSAYSGGGDGASKEKLEQQLRVYKAIYWLWLANRYTLSLDDSLIGHLKEAQQSVF